MRSVGTSTRRGFISIDWGSLPLSQAVREHIDVEQTFGNGNIDPIRGDMWCSTMKVSQGDSWRLVNEVRECQQRFLRYGEAFQVLVVVFQDLPVVLNDPIDLVRGAYLIRESEAPSRGFTRRTAPGTMFVKDVAIGLLFRESDEFLDGFALLPPRRMVLQHKVIGDMQGCLSAPMLVQILQSQRGIRLIKVLEHVGPVLCFQQKGKLNTMALGFDDAVHFRGFGTRQAYCRGSHVDSGWAVRNEWWR